MTTNKGPSPETSIQFFFNYDPLQLSPTRPFWTRDGCWGGKRKMFWCDAITIGVACWLSTLKSKNCSCTECYFCTRLQHVVAANHPTCGFLSRTGTMSATSCAFWPMCCWLWRPASTTWATDCSQRKLLTRPLKGRLKGLLIDVNESFYPRKRLSILTCTCH